MLICQYYKERLSVREINVMCVGGGGLLIKNDSQVAGSRHTAYVT